MFCGGKEKFLFKTKLSLPAFHLLLAFINNAKTESSALMINSINITRRSIDTRLFVSEKLRNKLSKPGQVRTTFGANFEKQT